MKTLRIAEWCKLYQTLWRAPFAQLTKEERCKIVRGCKGKAIYESYAEANAVVPNLPSRGKLIRVHAYTCPLCGGIHIGNTRKSGKHAFRRLETL